MNANALVALAVAGLTLLSGPSAVVPQPEDCFPTCTANDSTSVIVPGGFWVPLAVVKYGGEATAYCEPCVNCRCRFFFAYYGSGGWSWKKDSGDEASGTGNASASVGLSTACDGQTDFIHWYSENGGTMVSALYCPCQI